MIFAALVLAVAGPGDRRLSLDEGARVIEKAQADAVEAEGVIHAELLPTGEVLIEAPKKGFGTVFLFTRREVQAIEVAVGTPFPAPAPKPEGCPVIRDAACYAKWRAAVQPGDKVVFELEGLQAEAAAAQRELSAAGLPGATVALSPLGVRVKGVREGAELRQALRAIWRAVVGPLRIDG